MQLFAQLIVQDLHERGHAGVVIAIHPVYHVSDFLKGIDSQVQSRYLTMSLVCTREESFTALADQCPFRRFGIALSIS